VFHNLSSVEKWGRIADAGGAMEELAECVRAGKTRFRGISSHHPDVLVAAIPSGLCDVVMFPLGPHIDARYRDEVLPLAQRHGVGVVSFKTFGAGMLLGDTAGYGKPIEGPGGKPRLTVDECVRYTLGLDPDVALLGMSTESEQDAALDAARAYEVLDEDARADVVKRAAKAIEGKGPVWWNPSRR
jgi:predicted aldo/keto reductase-like oxidoreductase